jgi:hypothetical protein
MWSRSCYLLLICLLLWERTLAVPTRVTWVNGIAHNTEHMEEGQLEIAQLFGLPKIEYYHNPTAMKYDDDLRGYAGDLFQASTQLAGRITHEVDELVDYLKRAIHAVGPHGVVVHIAHSQGALITSLAAKLLSADELSQVECLCFGGAAVLTRRDFPSLKRAVNYYSVNDPLLFVVPSASKALQTGVFTPPPPPGTMAAVNAEPEFVFLTPKCGNPTEDHGLLNPTYGEALAWEGRRYQVKYQNPIIRQFIRPAYIFVCQVVLFLWTRLILHNPVLEPLLKVCHFYISEMGNFVRQDILLPLIRLVKLLMEVIAYRVKILRGGNAETIFEPITVEKP